MFRPHVSSRRRISSLHIMPNDFELIVTNMHRDFTGVSATVSAVVRKQATLSKVQLVGQSLPGCPRPITYREAVKLTRQRLSDGARVIWHVRRNNEMRAALWVRDGLRLPIRIVFTSAAQRRHSPFPRWLISRMDGIIATTQAAASFLPKVSATVHHGVDAELFHPADDPAAEWNKNSWPGDMGVATIGRIRPEKGTDLFVDAMIGLLPDIPDATALIIGKAKREHRAFEADLRARIATAGLSERIIFVGEIASEQMPALVRSLSLLVATPRYEGYGLTPLEAMASGVPIVATNTGFFSSFIGDNEAGTLVEQPDPADIASAAQTLLQNPLEQALKSSSARNRAISNFGIDKEVAGIQQVYEALWDEPDKTTAQT